ncbi:hypothetical protein HZA39_02830 [Candidatus Peregrinibacteria bacterium]|nr:hypothetical protein [Candidatus Peregrinibacteria bacterium]
MKTKTKDAAQKEKILEKNLHEKFVKYGENARKWMNECKMLLPEIARRKIWEKRRFSSIYEYAAKLAGMSKNTVDDALWIVRKVEDKPALKAVAEEKGINIIKPIAGIITAENADFWAEKANGMSMHALQVYVREFKKADLQTSSAWDDFRGAPKNYYENQNLFSDIKTEQIIMDLEPEIADQFKKLKGNGNWNDLAKKLLEAYKAQIEAKKPLPVENAKRHIPVKIKKYALAKTNSACAFPGCARPYEILHHTERFALTHAHDPDALTPLCKAHERIAHFGLIENENKPASEWRVMLAPDKNKTKYKIDQKVLKYRSAFG